MNSFEDYQAHLKWHLQRQISRAQVFAGPRIAEALSSRFVGPAVAVVILIEFGLFFTVRGGGFARALGPALLVAGVMSAIAQWSMLLFDRQQADRDTQLRLTVGEQMSERDFARLDLTGNILAGAVAQNASFRSARLMGVDFAGANLASSTFAGAMAGYADFGGADMTWVEADHGEFVYASFANADLSGSHFSFADLRSADLAHADLRNADFSGADLRGADLTGAQTLGARFDGAISSEDTLWPERFKAAVHREERGLDEIPDSSNLIDLTSSKQLAIGAAACMMLLAGVSIAKVATSDSGSARVMGETAQRVSYEVGGTAAVVTVTLTNEFNGTEEFQELPTYQRFIEVPAGYELSLTAEVEGAGTATCRIEDSEGVLSQASVQGNGARAVCSAKSR